MFDIGFSELLLFGVIALIVLGPEKLPQAARTAGQWYGKIRRTVSTLQSEIEAELDLAETRQQMQKELAKIRQTEAEMRREMAEMRGSMQEFESAQNHSLKDENNSTSLKKEPNAHKDNDTAVDASKSAATPTLDEQYAYDSDLMVDKQSEAINTDSASSDDINTPIMTRPWENMWFRLGAYDKARRLPAAPYMPNYKADTLLYSQTDADNPMPHNGEASL
jgi:sec-independent protein translocase protein TatB